VIIGLLAATAGQFRRHPKSAAASLRAMSRFMLQETCHTAEAAAGRRNPLHRRWGLRLPLAGATVRAGTPEAQLHLGTQAAWVVGVRCHASGRPRLLLQQPCTDVPPLPPGRPKGTGGAALLAMALLRKPLAAGPPGNAGAARLARLRGRAPSHLRLGNRSRRRSCLEAQRKAKEV